MNQQLIRLGVFASVGILIIVGFSVYVNDQPFWYRTCNTIDITVDDATGLRRKSPVKTLGLDIGYIRSVDLDGTNVIVNVCVTAPVKLRSDTRAYVRSIGFLGDRFLELKPVDVHGSGDSNTPEIKKLPAVPTEPNSDAPPGEESRALQIKKTVQTSFLDWLIPSAQAEEAQAASLISTAQAANNSNKTTLQASREAEITDTMKKVSKLVDQLTFLVKDLREATSQVEFKDLVVNFNEAAKNLAQLLDPKNEVSQNIRKSMESMRRSLKDLEESMAKVNQGKGTIGKLLNDDKLYEEAVSAIRGLNLLLGKAGNLKVYVDLSAHRVPIYDGTKARFFLQIEPNPTRYYLIGISTDPRGTEERTTTETIVNGSSSKEEKIVTREQGVKFTLALGKYFGPLDLKVGLIENAGTIGVGYWLDEEHRFGIMSEIYKPSKREAISVRVYARAQIFMGLYVKGGVEDTKEYTYNGKRSIPYFVGAGLYFNDEDIKYLLAFK